MGRISVYNSRGQAGTIEEGDSTGGTFLPEVPSFPSEITAVTGKFLNPFLGYAPGIILQKARQVAQQIPTGQFNPLTETPLGRGLSSLFLHPPQSTLGKLAGIGAELTGLSTGVLEPVSTGAIAVGKRAVRGVGTLGGGAATLFSKRRQVALAEKARNVFGEVIRGAGPAMEQELGHLPGTVDLRHVIDPLKNSLLNLETGTALQEKVFQGIQTAAKIGDTTLRDVLNNPELAQKLTPLQAQQIMNTLRQAGSVAKVVERGRTGAFFGKGGRFLQQVSGEDLQLLQHANEIKQTLATAYPEAFPQIGKKFGETVSAGRLLAPKFKEGHLVGNILTGFRDPEVAAKVWETLPLNTAREVFAPSRAARAGKVAGAVVGGGALVGGLKSLLRR